MNKRRCYEWPPKVSYSFKILWFFWVKFGCSQSNTISHGKLNYSYKPFPYLVWITNASRYEALATLMLCPLAEIKVVNWRKRDASSIRWSVGVEISECDLVSLSVMSFLICENSRMSSPSLSNAYCQRLFRDSNDKLTQGHFCASWITTTAMLFWSFGCLLQHLHDAASSDFCHSCQLTLQSTVNEIFLKHYLYHDTHGRMLFSFSPTSENYLIQFIFFLVLSKKIKSYTHSTAVVSSAM